MKPPTTTHNAKELHAYMKGGKPCAVLHDSAELKAARSKLHAYLAPHAPDQSIFLTKRCENLLCSGRRWVKGVQGTWRPP